jgi:hypothetical protein
VPTLFVPLEDTRLQKRESAKLFQLTELQWECFFTCWRNNLDFFHRSKKAHLVYNMGIPLYYYFLGRRLFGKAMKYPLLRIGHFPESILKHKLYLDFTGTRAPRYRVPEIVPIPEHFARPSLPIIGPPRGTPFPATRMSTMPQAREEARRPLRPARPPII